MIATELSVINTASDAYGDVPTSVDLSLAGVAHTTFPYEVSIQPTYLRGDEEDRTDQCPVTSRCILPVGLNWTPDDPPRSIRLLVVASQRDLLDVAGGSARSGWLSFALSDCEGMESECSRYAGFATSVASLRAMAELTPTITLDFHSDGRKTVICRTGLENPQQREAFFDFLEDRGWASLRCARD